MTDHSNGNRVRLNQAEQRLERIENKLDGILEALTMILVTLPADYLARGEMSRLVAEEDKTHKALFLRIERLESYVGRTVLALIAATIALVTDIFVRVTGGG